jgi:hypothetical protein
VVAFLGFWYGEFVAGLGEQDVGGEPDDALDDGVPITGYVPMWGGGGDGREAGEDERASK